jgi:hypothetical protein
VWQESETGYQLLAEVSEKPSGETLDRILLGERAGEPGAAPAQGKRGGFLGELQSFLRALTQ